MKKTSGFVMLTVVLAVLVAGCSRSLRNDGQSTDSTAVAAKQQNKVLYWYDPMNPTVHFQHSGKSPFMDMELQPMYAEEGSYALNIISVDPAMVQNIGVVTAPVERRKLTRTINAYGVVVPDEKSISDINTRATGWVEKLFFDYTGMEVRAGQPMAEVYSPELIAAEQEFLQAANFASAAGNAVSQSNTLMRSARERLAFFGMSEKQIDDLQSTGKVIDRVVIHSTRDGEILEKNVYEGQRITSGETLFKIADLRHVWVLADVFKIDMPFLNVGSLATVQYDRARSYSSAVDFIYPEVDPTARSVKARIPLSNPQMAMKVGQYVDVAIQSSISFDALAVPSQAVINTGLRQVVAVALGDGKFEMRDVKLGPYGDGYYAVNEGLSEGEDIVTSGQFLIDSDANLRSAGASLGGGTTTMNVTTPAHSGKEKGGTAGMNGASTAEENSGMEK